MDCSASCSVPAVLERDLRADPSDLGELPPSGGVGFIFGDGPGQRGIPLCELHRGVEDDQHGPVEVGLLQRREVGQVEPLERAAVSSPKAGKCCMESSWQ